MISAIVAVDNNYGIGNKNGLLAHIPEDLKLFKELTMNNTVIMGRKTFDSLPVKPLPSRNNIVITSKVNDYTCDYYYNDVVLYSNMELAKRLLTPVNNIFIMGGGTIYRELLPYCQRVYLTKILHNYEEVDTYFPNIDNMPEWVLTSESEEKEYEGVKYKFCVYDKKQINKKVFILNGCGGVGKDTFVNLVSKYVPTVHFSSVTKVKEIAKAIGWDGSKTEKDRKFLSDLKLLCTGYNNMPLNSMREKVNEFMIGNEIVLFLDVREPDEIEIAKQAFNAETILVVRDSVEHISSNMADDNVYNYQYDYIIENNGSLDDLDSAAKTFVSELWGM